MGNNWRFDRRISLAVIITIALQMCGVLVWATTLDARVGNIEKRRENSIEFQERFVRMEERLENMRQDMVYIKRQLERLTTRLIGK